MRLYQAGEKSVGICESCRAKVTTRMEYRDYKPTGWDITIPDVLVAVCEVCSGVVAVPHQSMPKINESRKAKDSSIKKVEVRVPRSLEESLDLIAASLGVERKIVRTALIRYYLNLVAEDHGIAKEVKERSLGLLAKGKANGRISLNVPDRQWSSAWAVARSEGIVNAGQLIRGVAVLAADDFGIHASHESPRGFKSDAKATMERVQFIKTLKAVLSC